MDSADHISIMRSYLPDTELDGMVCNDFYSDSLPNNVSWCKISAKKDCHIRVFEGNLVNENYPWRHDPDKLTNILIQAWEALKTPSEQPLQNG